MRARRLNRAWSGSRGHGLGDGFEPDQRASLSRDQGIPTCASNPSSCIGSSSLGTAVTQIDDATLGNDALVEPCGAAQHRPLQAAAVFRVPPQELPGDAAG